MTVYAIPIELGDYLPQVDVGATDDQLKRVLSRAQVIVDRVLGFTYAGYSAAEKTVKAAGGTYLKLPPHQAGSVTAVTDYSGSDIDSSYWNEQDTGSLAALDDYGNVLGWAPGFYKVTAAWGYGAVPADVVEVTLELAVTIWQGRQAGKFSDVVGVEGGGAVGYNRALTALQRMALVNARAATRSGIVV